VEDPTTHKRIPTCHRVQSESILKDADYIATIKNAPDEYSRSLYEEEAKKISEIQKDILKISKKEQPYDVFICYKESTDGGSRTKDSTIAQDIYYQLINDGYRVFFAKITLEDKLGQEYEPYIFSALNSAKVMLVVGTKPEYFNAVWVKNEWSRYLALMKKDRSKLLIPCYRDMDAYDIPDELSALQSQDMSKVGFMQDILRGVKKVLDTDKATETTTASAYAGTTGAAPGVESLMKRGHLFLEDSDWKQAVEYFNKVLDIDPEYAPAYIGLLCAELEAKSEAGLVKHKEPFDKKPNFQKAIRFANADYRAKLDGYNETIIKRIEEQRQKWQQYNEKARQKMQQLLIEKEQLIEKDRQEKEQEKQRRIEEEQRHFKLIEPKIRELQNKIKEHYSCVSVSSHTVCLKTNGTVVAVGDNENGQCNTSSWRDIIAISTGSGHTVGLKADGTVVAIGNNDCGQCNTSKWRNIIAISASNSCTVGLKAGGTVVAVGYNYYDQCNTSKWRNIIAISASNSCTVGLKADGTVVAVGDSNHDLCNTSRWRDIIAISASAKHTVGLKADGTVAAVGDKNHGQCNTGSWRDIIAISAGDFHTVGLKANGTVVAVGHNNYGRCNTSDWRDVIAIFAGTHHTLGLKIDGTVVAAGDNNYGRCNTSDWRDIIAISASAKHTVGLKADGTVVAVGDNKDSRCNTSSWRDIGPVNKEKLKKQTQEENAWAKQGLCRKCGGQMGGLFTKKCKVCGKPA
jgi:alpha-tubulin suppressor-like RCC1 family protein